MWFHLHVRDVSKGNKQSTLFFSDGGTRATKVLELVCRPMKTTSIGGRRYFLTFINNFSKKVWMFVVKSKREVFGKFVERKALVDR